MKTQLFTCDCGATKSLSKRGRAKCPICKVGRVRGYLLTCPGYEGHKCGKVVELDANQSRRVRCDECAAEHTRIKANARSRSAYAKTEKKRVSRAPRIDKSWWHSRPCSICGQPTVYPDWCHCPACKEVVGHYAGQTGNDEVLGGRVNL